MTNGAQVPVIALIETRFEAAAPGAKAKPDSRGFALTRTLWRVKSDGAAAEKAEADADGVIKVKTGEVIEEVAELVNPQDRTHVAISLPLAAGFEPLNPNLATAPREAQPSAPLTLPASWTSYGDDRVFYAYDSLPKGNYRFVFRVKAQTRGKLHAARWAGRDDVQEGHCRDERRRARGDCRVSGAREIRTSVAQRGTTTPLSAANSSPLGGSHKVSTKSNISRVTSNGN